MFSLCTSTLDCIKKIYKKICIVNYRPYLFDQPKNKHTVERNNVGVEIEID